MLALIRVIRSSLTQWKLPGSVIVLVADRIWPMSKIKQQLEGLARLLRSLASQLLPFSQTTLLPLAGRLWHLSLDLATLVITRDNLRRLRRELLVSLMRVERRIESWLPGRFRHEKYYKDLKHGRAPDREPVTYVNKIRNYQNILHAQLARKQGIHVD